MNGKIIDVLDSTLFYQEIGSGVPMVFLHGNPASSYLWRHVLPRISGPGRCLAPDLIGMGNSGKPNIPYRYDDHARYLEAWFDKLGLDDVVLIGIDWGGSLAFDWAARHPAYVRGVAFMETIVRPMSWSDLPVGARSRFEAFRTPGIGERMVLDENVFIEGALNATVLTPLGDAEKAAYRKPYLTRDSRRPMLEWPRAMPLDGEPADVVARINAYDDWLARSEEVPKLLLTFDGSPTLMIGEEMRTWCEANIASLEIAHCGAAGHLAPEDQPEAIAAAITSWADRHRLRSDFDVASVRSEPPAEVTRSMITRESN